jgi:hypothetical protein
MINFVGSEAPTAVVINSSVFQDITIKKNIVSIFRVKE